MTNSKKTGMVETWLGKDPAALMRADGWYLTGIKLKWRGADWSLIVTRAEIEGDRKEFTWLARSSPWKCLVSFLEGYYKEEIVWKEDKPWGS